MAIHSGPAWSLSMAWSPIPLVVVPLVLVPLVWCLVMASLLMVAWWRPWPTKTWANFHEGSMVCHIWCKWLCHGFCCTISMMGTQWHCNVVPIDGSLAHTTWTSLWLLVVLAYGRLRGAPMHPSWSMHLGLELHGLAPGLLALGVLLLAKHFPWLSVSAGGWKAQGAGFWRAHSAGLALKLHTKHGFCEASFAT